MTVKVPGKIMVAGEYTVLNSGLSLSSTVNQFMWVNCSLSENNKDEIRSDYWTEPFTGDVTKLPTDKLLSSPLLSTVAWVRRKFSLSHLSLVVNSQLSPSFGFGSSSALRLGIISAAYCLRYSCEELSAEQSLCIARWSKDLQEKDQHGFSSGYDIITQVTGSVVLFKSENGAKWPEFVRQVPGVSQTLNKYVRVYCGGKGAKTSEVVGKTFSWLQKTSMLSHLSECSQKLISLLIDGSRNDDYLYELSSRFHSCRRVFEKSEFFPTQLASDLKSLAGVDKYWSFKMTGAGGEDSILLVGEDKDLQAAHDLLTNCGWFLFVHNFSNNKMEIECTRT